MTPPRANAAHASVVFLKIPEFTQQAVAEQSRLKGLLEGALGVALAGVSEADRIVLEAADGAAVVVLGNPVSALQLARRAAAAEKAVPVAVGINHGPVRVAGVGASPIVIGDGLVTADAMAGFAGRGRIAATREFRDTLLRTAPGHAARLAPAGTRTDARDRSYQLFLDDEAAAARRRRGLRSLAVLSFAAIVALGVGARFVLERPAAPEAARQEAPAKPVVTVAPPAPRLRAPEPAALATVKLEIRPRGEVFVDGISKGTSPPLASIQVPAGKHDIEIRYGKAAPVRLQVNAAAGEELSVRHTFPAPPAQQPKPAWRRWYDQVKGQFK